MVGGHRRGSPSYESSSEGDHSGDGGPRMPSSSEDSRAARGPWNPRYRVPAYTKPSGPSAQPPSPGAAGGATSGAHRERSLAASLVEVERPQRPHHPRRQETPLAPSQEREAG